MRETGERLRRRLWPNGLSRRLGLFLTLALVPVGALAIVLTINIDREFRARTETAIRATTLELAAQERLSINSAFSAISALAAATEGLSPSGAACSDVLGRFVARSEGTYTFAGLITADGQMTCSSTGQTADFSDTDSFRAAMADPSPRIDIDLEAPMSGRAVVLVTDAFGLDDGEPDGFITLSLPRVQGDDTSRELAREAAGIFFTVNAAGDLLTSSTTLDATATVLPANLSASPIVGAGPQQFVAENTRGASTFYSVEPVADGAMYAVGAWIDDQRYGAGPLGFLSSPFAFAIGMWLASLVLVTLTVERQVVKPILDLAGKMHRFVTRRELPETPRAGLSEELIAVNNEFSFVAHKLINDEAELVDAVHEQQVLLKEVHHRVKNNLQLISSMINMKLRRSDDPETVDALTQINVRVASMATVHRLLYQAEALRHVRADDLLQRISSPLANLAPRPANAPKMRVKIACAPITLYPDQALPLALLTVEAVTNALKYAGSSGGDEPPWVRVSLDQVADTSLVRLDIDSSLTRSQHDALSRESPSSSLGARLIESFARQLGAGAPFAGVEEGVFRVRVEFEAQQFSDDTEPDEPHPLDAPDPAAI